MFETIKWDGTSPIMHEMLIKEALIGEKGFFSEDEIRLAKQTSYGDLAELLKKNHKAEGNHGRCGDYPVSGSPAAVTVHLPELEIQYEMTWNKAAKAVHRWVHEEAENSVPAVSSDAVLSEEYAKAVKLDLNIKTNAQAAQMSLYEVCKGLKEMRDGKLYKQLGYANFEEYTENEVGIKHSQAYKMINIVEKLSEDFFHSSGKIGMTKLSLLATLEEEQRTEIIENNDIESTSVRELKAEIERLKQETKESSDSLKNSESERAALAEELDEAYDKVHELENTISDMESRPIDVTYSDADSHEVENMRKAMDKMDLEWSTKYAEEQERNIKEVQELNIKHTAELNQMKAEYEDKIRNTASESSIGKEKVKQKSDIYIDMLNSIMDDIEDFLFEINDSSLQARHIKRFINCVQEFIDRVDDDEGE